MSTDTADRRLTEAQEAADRHEWQESYALLAELDAEKRLDGAGLELLGTIAWWASEADQSVAARERAFAAYLDAGDRARAAFMAVMAAWDHHNHLSEALAMGWRSRATRILDDEPECIAHGMLYVLDSFQLTAQGDFDGAAKLSADAVAIGARFGDKDIQGYGLVSEGMALVRKGDIVAGLALLDEATAAAVAGELSPFATGVVYCQTISTCRDLADYRRAGQWTEVAERWCERQAISGFPGICRVHRAEIMSLHGEWTNALAQAERASQELLAVKAMPQAAEGFYALGEVRLRIGDLEGASEAFREADDLGREPEPGRSLLMLAQGRTDAAVSSIRRALANPWLDALTRARMLPAQVEIAVSGGNLEMAQKASAELTDDRRALRLRGDAGGGLLREGRPLRRDQRARSCVGRARAGTYAVAGRRCAVRARTHARDPRGRAAAARRGGRRHQRARGREGHVHAPRRAARCRPLRAAAR